MTFTLYKFCIIFYKYFQNVIVDFGCVRKVAYILKRTVQNVYRVITLNTDVITPVDNLKWQNYIFYLFICFFLFYAREQSIVITKTYKA